MRKKDTARMKQKYQQIKLIVTQTLEKESIR